VRVFRLHGIHSIDSSLGIFLKNFYIYY